MADDLIGNPRRGKNTQHELTGLLRQSVYSRLAANEEVRERRAGASRVVYAKPELLATRPNEVWSWDVSMTAL